ncbi:hypothetical protein B0A55_12385 [Friedmanniomyces simplex]|uniref:Uncharacterized protein n=1 Tax=Friedmanniomyces simplex TaxID=329884 RepID=A0A4U0VWE0_9PEZI|nr:hypothetical protein B0A55_12385 [Friedmanniomyces simplex]
MRDFRRRQREEKEKSDGVLSIRQASPEESHLQISEGSHEPIRTRQSSGSGFQVPGYIHDQQYIPSIKIAGSVYNEQYLLDPKHRTRNERRLVILPLYDCSFDHFSHSGVQAQFPPEHDPPEWTVPENMYLTPEWMTVQQQPYATTTSRSPSIWGSNIEEYIQSSGQIPQVPQGCSLCQFCAVATLNAVLCDVCSHATYDDQAALATSWHGGWY